MFYTVLQSPGQTLDGLLPPPPAEEPGRTLRNENQEENRENWYESSWQGGEAPWEAPAKDVHQQVACRIDMISALAVGMLLKDRNLCWRRLASR